MVESEHNKEHAKDEIATNDDDDEDDDERQQQASASWPGHSCN